MGRAAPQEHQAPCAFFPFCCKNMLEDMDLRIKI